jgi:putative glutamine amidotransferase
VNSFHHQAIDRIGVGLEIVARAPDGIVEAVVMPGRRFVLGVQWHPELMFADHPAQFSLFGALTDAARASQSQEVVAAPQ